MNGGWDLAILLGHLLLLSLLAIGGVNPVIPELHRLVVLDQAWLTSEEFTQLFALAQAAPGPNLIFVTLLGWRLGGIPGGLAATAAICGPGLLIALAMIRLVRRWADLSWFRTFGEALLPLTTGLVIATAWLLTAAAAQGPVNYLLTFAAAGLMLATRVNPIWVLAVAAGLGLAGVV